MPALIDTRLCDSSPYCSASRTCPKGAMSFDRNLKQVVVRIELCDGCPGYCARACPMRAVRFAPTMEAYERLKIEMLTG